jgi:hypothetical protein
VDHRGDAGFAKKALYGDLVSRRFWKQKLDGDVLLEPEVRRRDDDPHATLAKRSLDSIFARDDRAWQRLEACDVPRSAAWSFALGRKH